MRDSSLKKNDMQFLLANTVKNRFEMYFVWGGDGIKKIVWFGNIYNRQKT